MTFVITENCLDLKDMSCIAECPVDCIYEGGRMLYIHPDECVDCDACQPVCPVDAIYEDRDVPEQWKSYIDTNRAFFDDLGSPGGASKLGPLPHDAPTVSARTPATLPAPEYSGILREFAGIAPPAPGNVALLCPGNNIEAGLVDTLLLFYDRILVIHDPRITVVSLGPKATELREAGLIDIADIDGWAVELVENLLNTFRGLPSLGQSLKSAILPYTRDRNMTRAVARLTAIIDQADIQGDFKDWWVSVRGLASLFFPQLVQFAARGRGLQIESVTSDQSYASVIESLAIPMEPGRSTLWDFEAVTPDLSAVETSDLLAFRATHGHLFRRHLHLLRRHMREIEISPYRTGWEDWAQRRDEIAESAYLLRKVSRQLRSKGGGIWSLGAIGDLARSGDSPGQTASIGRRALEASGISMAAGAPDIFTYVFTATRSTVVWEETSG